jgi:hypothetical protein
LHAPQSNTFKIASGSHDVFFPRLQLAGINPKLRSNKCLLKQGLISGDLRVDKASSFIRPSPAECERDNIPEQRLFVAAE